MRRLSHSFRLIVLFALLILLFPLAAELRQSHGQEQEQQPAAPEQKAVPSEKPAAEPTVEKKEQAKEEAAAGKVDDAKKEVDKGLLAGAPVSAGHLTVFPLYHKERRKPIDVLCMAEAVDSKTFVINEVNAQGTVKQVEVVNNSGKAVLLLGGEVIFGGKQDRIVAKDTLVPAGKGEKMMVPVYCVEHGRWTPREAPGNTAGQFSCGEKKQLGAVARAEDSGEKRAGKTAAAGLEEETTVTKDVPRGTSFNNLSNKNLDSTSCVDAYGIGGGKSGAYGQRWGKGSLAREGGSPGTVASVCSHHRWLHYHQSDDGRWKSEDFNKECDEKQGGTCSGASNRVRDVEVTALALLAFLGNGHTHRVGTYKKTVRKGFDWLLSKQQKDGSFKEEGSKEDFPTIATAATALFEAYAITRDQQLIEPAEKVLKHLLGCQEKNSGWAKQKGGRPDTLSTGWAVIALKAAKAARLSVPPESFAGAINYFDSATDNNGWTKMSEDDKDKTTPRGTAISMICRIFCGQSRRDPKILKGVDLLMKNLPEYDKPDNKKVDYEYWFWGTYSMFQYGGKSWHAWNEAMKNALVSTQRQGGCPDGSWDPVGHSAALGRVGTSAYATLTLQIYYRYARANPGPHMTRDMWGAADTQKDIWNEVKKVNEKMGTENATGTFRNNLTTQEAENKVSDPLGTLTKAFLGDEEIIGFACAINGEILFVDMFHDTRLAGQYKYRLLRSYVLEAVSRGDKSTGVKTDRQDLADFIAQGNKGDISKTEKARQICYSMQVTGGVLRTEVKLEDEIVRRAYYKLER